MRRYALILAHNRPKELVGLLDAIEYQVDTILVIDNASEPPIHQQEGVLRSDLVILRDMTQPANLSRLWNIGFDWIRNEHPRHRRFQGEPWNVAVLTDDVLPPPGWFNVIEQAMDDHSCVAGCSSPFPQFTEIVVKRAPDADIMRRMYGPAFILRGDVGLQANEDLHWWWGDTDLDWQARQAGGLVIIPGYPVPNLYANASTVGYLAERAGLDAQNFAAKWGWRPW